MKEKGEDCASLSGDVLHVLPHSSSALRHIVCRMHQVLPFVFRSYSAATIQSLNVAVTVAVAHHHRSHRSVNITRLLDSPHKQKLSLSSLDYYHPRSEMF